MKKLALIFALLSLSLPAQGNAKLLIIAHPGVEVSRLSIQDVQWIYTKKMNFWPNLTAIRPMDWMEGTPTRQLFLRKVLKKTESEIAQYWIEQKFYAGRNRPLELESAQSMCDLVSSMEGAIGYVLADERTEACDQVKILAEW